MDQHDDLDTQADWNELEMSVLRSAERDAPPQGAVERTLSAIGVGAALGAGAGLGTASSLSGAAKLGSSMAHGSIWLKWLAAAVVGGGIASAIFLHRHSAASAPPVPISSQVAFVPATPEPSEPAPVLAPTPNLGNALNTASAAAPLPARSSVTRAPSPAENKADLAAEIRLIDEARDHLRRGDAAGSLATLAAYDQLVKHGGSMRAEATVVRIEAYQKNGDSARAAALGQRFIAKNPGSPYAEYVKRILSRAN